MVVVIKDDELAQTPVAGQRSGFRADAFHQAAIAANRIRIMIDDLVSRLVVASRQMGFGHRKTDGIGNALSERTGRRIDARGDVVFGMARRNAAELAELPDIIQTDRIAVQVKQGIEQRGGVAVREHKAIPVRPADVVRAKMHVAAPDDVCHCCTAHRCPRMTGIRSLNHVHRKCAKGQYIELIDVDIGDLCIPFFCHVLSPRQM